MVKYDSFMKLSKVVELTANTFSTSTSGGQLDLDVDLGERIAQYRQAVDSARSGSGTAASSVPVVSEINSPTKR